MNTPTPAQLSAPVFPPRVPWGVRDILFGLGAALVGIVALNLGLVAINTVAGNLFEKSGLALTVFVALQDAIIVGAALLFSLVRYRVGGEMLGLKRFSAVLGCSMSASLLVVSYFVRLLYGVIAIAFGYRPSVQDVLNRLDTQGIGLLASFIAVSIIAPFAEEIVFRGFIYGGLRARFGVTLATISSTLFFTALHFSIEQFIPIFVLGLFLAWLYEKTGSLYPGIILHATNNGVSLLLLAVLRASGALPGF